MVTWIKQKLGIDVSDHCIANALKTVGVQLDKPIKEKTRSINNARTLATSLLKLYIKLGETPPPSLVQMVSRLDPSALPAQVIPVSSVPDPRTIPLVGKDKECREAHVE